MFSATEANLCVRQWCCEWGPARGGRKCGFEGVGEGGSWFKLAGGTRS